MEPTDLAWLAGLLEGEGSFMRPIPSAPRLPIVQLQMTDRDVVERAARLMGLSTWRNKSLKREDHGKDCWATRVNGTRARELMIQLRPLMGERRQAQIDAALAGPVFLRGDGPKISLEQAREIRERFAAGESAVSLGAEYGVSKWLVYRIKEGKRAS
jgi:hypothetical protein